MRRSLHLAVALLLASWGVSSASAAVGADTASCGALDRPVYEADNPVTHASLLTRWQTEAQAAAAYGFTDFRGAPFRASGGKATGLTAIQRLYRSSTHDFVWAPQGSSGQTEAIAQGYADQGTNFHAATAEVSGCTQPVRAYLLGGMHRYAQPAAGATLVARGWTAGAVAFHALPSPGTPDDPGLQPGTDTTFSFAVMPDTQDEVGGTDPKMPKRVDWLLGHRDALDLRWVLHSGDVQSWDTADHIQYVRMSSRLDRLTANGLPFVATPGNHDTGAVCPGGSACPGADTRVGLRDTRTWNTYYPPGRFGFEGLYEPGKSDNGWRTFQAGGLSWLVLSVEPWPRTGVVAWARQVVASHPHHNVILLTHAFLDASGRIAEDNGGYGATTSRLLWESLDDYPNLVMTFSGHVGQAASTSETADDGHKVATFLQAMHAPTTNPVRLVSVDTAAGTLTTEIRSSWDSSRPVGQQDVELVHPFSAVQTGMRFVR